MFRVRGSICTKDTLYTLRVFMTFDLVKTMNSVLLWLSLSLHLVKNFVVRLSALVSVFRIDVVFFHGATQNNEVSYA